MSLIITTPPTVEPVLLGEVKDRLRLTTSDDDAVIQDDIATARDYAETVTGFSLAIKSYALYLDTFPWHLEPIKLRAPLVSVDSVQYLDESYTWQTWDASEYWVAQFNIPAVVVPRHGFTYPCAVKTPGSVKVAYTAGFTPEACPETYKTGIRQLAMHLYEHPETITSEGLKEVPFAISAMFSKRKVWGF